MTTHTGNTGRGTLTVTMRPPSSPAQADADVNELSNPLTSQTIRADVDEYYFNQLRLRVAKDPTLAEHITVLYTDEDGQQHNIGLGFKDELRWPPRFLHTGWAQEIAIQRLRGNRQSPADSGRE